MAKGFCESPREDLILLPFSGITGTYGNIQNPVSIPSGYKPISVNIETHTYSDWCKIQLMYTSGGSYGVVVTHWANVNPVTNTPITGKILCAKI